VEPEPLRTGDCAAAVISKLREYIESSSRSENHSIEVVGDSDIEDDTACSSLKRSRRPSASDAAESARANKFQKRRLSTTDVRNTDSEGEDQDDHAGGDDDGDREAEDDGDVQGKGEDDDDGDGALLELARKIAKKIRSGLKKISKEVLTQDIEVWSPGRQKTVYDLSLHIEDRLWDQASSNTKSTEETNWMLKYLASCYALFRIRTGSSEPHLVENAQASTIGDKKSTKRSIRTLDKWRSAANVVNLIINGLSERWGWKADLVSHALASNNPETPIIVIF
jgi:hypothetical protein